MAGDTGSLSCVSKLLQLVKLSELPVPKRIELSKLIPQFIERAIAHEAEIAKEASEAAASIQQKLAEL